MKALKFLLMDIGEESKLFSKLRKNKKKFRITKAVKSTEFSRKSLRFHKTMSMCRIFLRIHFFALQSLKRFL